MPPRKETRKAYEDEKPSLPDPGKKGAQFLGWLRKLGYYWTLDKCKDYCDSIGLDLERFVDKMGKDRIKIARTRNGDVVVALLDRVWSGKWARKYGYELPHHRHKKTLSEMKEPKRRKKL
jgi:hypothetical protein